MMIVNYEVTFEIPVNLKKDIYIVSSENFLESFNRLFASYEELDTDWNVFICQTDTQIVTKEGIV